MRLNRVPKGRRTKAAVRSELKELLHPAHAGEPVCGLGCPLPGTVTCSRQCPEIPTALSSDPDKYPLEPRIAPLVFELKRLEVYEPCWSCEGHLGPDGELWKIPQIWFYAKSVVHVRLLADGVKELHLDGRLNTDWRVAVTFSDADNMATTFSLEPVLAGRKIGLPALHEDIDKIAEMIGAMVRSQADKLASKLR